MSSASLRVVPSGECLRGEGLVWLIGAVVCLLAATAGPMSVSVGSGWPHLRCSTIGSCQSTATSKIVKRAVLGLLCKNPTFTFYISTSNIVTDTTHCRTC